MDKDKQKVVQYLGEAHAHEQALTRVLQSQIAMTPRGSYRTALETHLDETRRHADRVERRLRTLGQGGNPITFVVGAVQSVVGQAVAIGKTPLDLVRGSGGEEKVLKNAKDACASEALEIATYTAIERLAEQVGDDETAKLAASIRADEERMLQRVLKEIPKLTNAVVRADVHGNSSYDVTKTGAADAVREAGSAAKETTRKAVSTAKRTSRQARKVPGVAQAEGQIKGAVASEEDLAIKRLRQPHRRGDQRQAARALADRSREGRQLRAQARQPHHDHVAHHLAARRRAVGGLRRADRRGDQRRPLRGRRRAGRHGAHLRARAQEPRQRAEGRRARARHGIGEQHNATTGPGDCRALRRSWAAPG